ncbi:MAG: UDP-glucose 4-epimerase GalE [bacterium]|nr:UDP-glucose 4-epimerase GalE [bacterium]
MEHILVTGGAGYIGSHVCKALHRRGYVPVTFDNFTTGHKWAVKWGPLEEGDLLDQTRLLEILSTYEPIAVMHFASCTSVGESVADPAKYYINNTAASLCLLEAMRQHGVSRFILSSTAAVYGTPGKVPIPESSPIQPDNPYGWSKAMVEQALKDYVVAYNFSSIALRYFNAAGADPEGELGEVHDPETHLIPLVFDAALGRRPRIEIFGEDYDTHDGTCIRDYVHVSDLAEAHVLALEGLMQKSKGFQAFNLGTGKGHTVSEVIETARRITGQDIPSAIAPRRPGDPASLVSNARLFQQEFSWKPAYPSLEDQIQSAWSWHKKYFGEK